MSTAAFSQMDIDLIAQELLKNTTFLMALSKNDVFVTGLSQNSKFVNAVSNNPVYIDGVKVRVNEELDNSFDARLATSELRPIKRIAKLEVITGLDDCYDEDEHEPTLPEKIQGIEDKINNYEPRPTVNPSIDKIPETKTEIRASLLVDALKASKKDYFSANEIMTFLKCKLPESCKIDDNVRNLRKVKQDVVSKAAQMFSSIVEPNQKKTGHRDIRLVLKS